MNGMEFTIATYVLSFLLLSGYALRLWCGIRRAAREQHSTASMPGFGLPNATDPTPAKATGEAR